MDSFKLTSWNIEHADKLLDLLDHPDDKKRRDAEVRAGAVAEELRLLDADILFISEGPRGKDRATDFFARVAPGYTLVTRPGDDLDDYGMKGGMGFAGRQWLWFLIRDGLTDDAQLLHLEQWQEMAASRSPDMYDGDKWRVSFPRWRAATPPALEDYLEFAIPQLHGHWRHPQVLQITLDGHFFEVIGCHLKSKFNRIRQTGAPSDEDFFEQNPELVAELIKARVKISTEATDIRHYIDARFASNSDAAIIVCGDLNDGPGKERIERRFLYHDLIGALQGDIFFAQRFLNHALFDAVETERWSVHFADKLDPGRNPNILLDHVLFSQAMTAGHKGTPFAFVARRRGGLIEHDVHHKVTSARPKKALTSDHRPVSMVFERYMPPLG